MEESSQPAAIPRTCTSCGSPVEPGHKFCEICGAKVDELPVCRKCGALFIAPVKFCELCGTAVIPDGSVKVHDEGPAPELPPLHEPDMMVPDGADEQEIPEPEPLPIPEQELPGPEPEEPVPIRIPLPAKSSTPLSGNALFLQDEEKSPGPEDPSRKNKSPNKVFVAGGIVLLLVVIAGILFIGLPVLQGNTALNGTNPSLATGDTPLPEQTTLPATMPTMMPTPVLTTPADPFLPLPTQLIPKNQEVYFDVQKDGVTGEITVLFQNGPGVNTFKSADVKVTHPDGSVVTGTLIPSKSTEIFLDGSKGNDRIEVIANMYTGQSYRVRDEMLPLKGH